jgi:hypothetical protein
MHIEFQKRLFAWECLEDHPTLRTIKELLELIPDDRLLDGLADARGKGRDDYSVRSLWGVVLLTTALRHRDYEACLGELGRNPSLAKLIGIESSDKIPKSWNISRFLETLGKEANLPEMQAIFNGMVQRLGEVVPGLGVDTAGDATALNARRRRCDAKQKREAKEAACKADGQQDAGGAAPAQECVQAGDPKAASARSEKEGKIEYDANGLPQPSGGRKEYKDDQGRVIRVVEWFGYKLHLLVDVKNEVVLAYRISSTKMGDNEVLPELVDQAQANLPQGRIKTLAYDKAADDIDVHKNLHKCGIKPLIQIRALWKEESEKLLPGHDGNTNIVYDEAGTLYCYDRVSEPMIRRKMAYIGHEPSRETLKYRCPAMHEGLECAMSSICNKGKKYGLTIRVKQEIDLRRFPPIPRATKQFERMYKGRTSVERVNARLKIFWGADDGNVTGAARFHAMVGVVMIVHAAFATLLASLPRREGTLGKMRLSPIAQAIRERIAVSK